MPAIQPENNDADDRLDYGLPWQWCEVEPEREGEDPAWVHRLAPAARRARDARDNGEEYNPTDIVDYAHGVTTCISCGGDSWCDDDHGRIVIAVSFTAHDLQRGWLRNQYHATAPVHLQCVHPCEGHGTHVDRELFSDDDNDYCDPCMEDRSICDWGGCDVEDWNDNLYFDEESESSYCEHHYNLVVAQRDDDDDEDEYDDDYDSDRRRRNSVIQPYSYRPVARFHLIDNSNQILRWDRTDPQTDYQNLPYLGFELETNCRGSYSERRELNQGGAKMLLEQHPNDYLYIKEDGSISGFEIVSHPATVYAHKQLLDLGALRVLALEYKQSSWTSVEGCGAGLHVHISKSSFAKPSHIQRFQMFHDSNQDVIKKFAGRDSRRWATFDRDGDSVPMIYLSRGGQQYNRYSALNFQNSATIELRYFRGSLEGTTLLGVLEFVHSVWRYTQIIHSKEISDGNIRWDRYRNWLLDENDNFDFNHLLPLMEKRGV